MTPEFCRHAPCRPAVDDSHPLDCEFGSDVRQRSLRVCRQRLCRHDVSNQTVTKLDDRSRRFSRPIGPRHPDGRLRTQNDSLSMSSDSIRIHTAADCGSPEFHTGIVGQLLRCDLVRTRPVCCILTSGGHRVPISPQPVTQLIDNVFRIRTLALPIGWSLIGPHCFPTFVFTAAAACHSRRTALPSEPFHELPHAVDRRYRSAGPLSAS